ncbi:peptidoglycan-binding protein [filamentous cyanobacterium LEGE 07170]|nr:peptidoglycan-binding protein [filamentous cyanobacterium LEGE 07170]
MKLPMHAIDKFWRRFWRSALVVGGTIASSLLIAVESAIAQIYEFGDTGSAVADIQRALGIFADGVYREGTESAVIQFQQRLGLAVDGVAGPETLRALDLDYLVGGVGGGGFGDESTAIISTFSGIGVNIRDEPNGVAVAGVDDGTRVQLTGDTASAGGRQWSELVGGGWVATEFLAFDGTTGGGDFPGRGTAILPTASSTQGPYIVAVPGGSRRDLERARQVSRIARLDTSSQGTFINAGGYSSRDDAEALASLLRFNGLDARVTYRRYY